MQPHPEEGEIPRPHHLQRWNIHRPRKTDVVTNWTPPSRTKQVRTFLGFVEYYWRFIKAFSKIAAPLNALLVGTASLRRGKTAIDWTPECQVAFDALKTALVSAPILAYADFSKPFHLYTDASLGGLGVVLAQVQDSRERVIAYASGSLLPTERNYQNYSSFKHGDLWLTAHLSPVYSQHGGFLILLTSQHVQVHHQSFWNSIHEQTGHVPYEVS